MEAQIQFDEEVFMESLSYLMQTSKTGYSSH